MKINFYGTMRELAGVESLEYGSTTGLTVGSVLDLLVASRPQLSDILLDSHGRLYDHIPIFVNGRNPRLLPQGLATQLEDQDVVSLFSAIASGRMNVETLKRSGKPNEGSGG